MLLSLYENLKGGAFMAAPHGYMREKVRLYIENTLLHHGYSPSIREIQAAVGLKSTSTVHEHIKNLEKNGLIKRNSLQQFTLPSHYNTTQYEGRNVNSVPLVGTVTAGVPILAVESIEEYISLPDILVGDGENYILKVSGESMIYAGIMDGDYVVVRKQSTAFNGDIVVAMIDDEATIKRYYKEKDLIRLQPENITMKPIFTRNCIILGKVISLYRIF